MLVGVAQTQYRTYFYTCFFISIKKNKVRLLIIFVFHSSNSYEQKLNVNIEMKQIFLHLKKFRELSEFSLLTSSSINNPKFPENFSDFYIKI